MEMEALVRDPRWFFPLSQWRRSSPSRQDGISYEQELVQQSKGVQFVTRMATSLRLPPQTIFAATLYLHRFYTRYSLKRAHPYEIAAACVFLAGKTEDSPRMLKEVATIATKAALKLPKTPAEIEAEHRSDVDQWIKLVPQREDDLLQALKFDFADTAPYEHLSHLVNTYVPADQHSRLGSSATMFLNDSCLTLLGVTATMPRLAAAALYWASKTAHTPIPDGEGNVKWYAKTAARAELVQIINDMAEMTAIVRNGAKIEGQSYERIK